MTLFKGSQLCILPPRRSGSNCRPAGTGAASWDRRSFLVGLLHYFSIYSNSYLLAFFLNMFCHLCDVWLGNPVLSIHSTLENYLFSLFTSFLLLKNYLVIFPRFCFSVCEPLPGACFPCWVEVAFLLLTAPLWPFTHLCPRMVVRSTLQVPASP